MYVHLGDWVAGDTIPFPFPAYDSNGASVTITGLAVTDIELYTPLTGGTVERASDNGYALLDTDGIDYDGRVGIHGFSVDTGDNSVAGFYTAGRVFWVIVDAVTIDSQTVRFIYSFTLGKFPANTTAGRTLDIQATGEVDANVTLFGGTAGTFAAGRPETNTTHVGGTLQTAGNIMPSLGEEAAAAGTGNPNSARSVMQYVKQLVNVLTGTAGIATFPAESAPGNGVSLAEVIRAIHSDVTGLNGATMRGTDNAALASVLGALTDAAADGDPTTADTAMQYIKQLINILVGTAGVTTFPAEAAPGNAVSLAEVMRAIYNDVTGIDGNTMRGTDNALLAASAPGNWSLFAIDGSGQVTVVTNNDKTGYRLSATGVDDILDEASADHTAAGTVGAEIQPVYHARVDLTIDTSNTQDEYTVQWYLNGAPVTSGVTVPTIQVINRVDGSDLIGSTAMAQIGTTAAYKYDATGAERMTAGEAVLIEVTATIGGSTRTWREVLSRDS